MKTIHCIFNAHLDPIWMWPWTAGLDEAIATSRSACDRLDANPDLFFTQGEAWTFAMVERGDPALFARIRAHVASGRWEIVNGWWTQPDCNLPTIDGLHAQLATGLAYVKEKFGAAPRCGFNPDTFGHCAAIPEVLAAHGQDRYVFMRPQEHERRLPGRLFRWQGRADGPAVTAFHIAGHYGISGVWLDGVRRALHALPEGVEHTMAFFGVGNHGGGPTERLVKWVRESRDAIEGARLVFSTVGRFFDAVAGATLPEVVGELQHHAIGCYSVVRSAKVALKRAEHALARASAAVPDARADLERAWRTTCAHQFHDTAGGSSIPEAYIAVNDQLAGAIAVADEHLAYAVRRRLHALPGDELPRLVLANPGRDAFAGWAEGTAYVEGPWRGPFRLLEGEREVPYQLVPSGAGVDPSWGWGLRRVLLEAGIAADGVLALRLDHRAPPTPIASTLTVAEDRVANAAGVAVEAGAWATTLRGPGGLALPIALHLIDDPTDTWTHGRDGYEETPSAVATWDAPRATEHGPLRATLRQTGRVGDSRITADWRVHAGATHVELLLEVAWTQRHRVLKLVVPNAGEATRVDGTPGLAVQRLNEGVERPLHDCTRLSRWAAVCPDVFALDATPRRTRFTLLRSPIMAHHDPSPPGFAGGEVADQGVHRFRFRFHLAAIGDDALMREARAWQRPPLVAELTRGMPLRMTEG